jgi:hypothetical protein
LTYLRIPYQPIIVDAKSKNLAKKLYGVFEMLRDRGDEFHDSGTAKMLREKSEGYFFDRSFYEYMELQGVIGGFHSHSGDFEEDFILESSQTFYWVALMGVVKKKSFEQFLKKYDKKINILAKLHLDNKIPFCKIFEKDLKECEEKGYI